MADSLSLYIHIPWCRARCGYCDFNTYVTDTADPAATGPYVAALLSEIGLAADTLGARQVGTIYFGGGTPTLMSPSDYGRVLAKVRHRFDVSEDAEITTEANPETIHPKLLAELRELGVNRLSMGMQSAVPHVLATLDRVHTQGRVADSVAWARAAGFDNLSLDLIFGTPGETLADWQTTLDAACALSPDHLSAYSLIAEPATPLARRMARGELPYPDEDDLADKYLCAEECLAAAGFSWYEVSNWALPGRECRHNLAYWRSQDWWGVGAGAHSHVAGRRWWNHRHPGSYVAAMSEGAPRLGSEDLDDDQRHTESVMLGLRLSEGLDERVLTPAELRRATAYLDSGHLIRQSTRLACTITGRLIADAIIRSVLS